MMVISVDIGLLWGEREIRGELICEFALQCWTDCNRWMDLDRRAGSFTARLAESQPDETLYAVRLAESLSPDHGSHVLDRVLGFSRGFDLDLVEAGKQWPWADGMFDNRVWWPVVKVPSRADAEALLMELRSMAGVNPLGLQVVPLARPSAPEVFDFTLGDFSARVLRVNAQALNPESVFWLRDVPVGRGFHWEHKETFEYRGELQLFNARGRGLTAVNRLPLETYLESTVGSEMRSDLPPAFSQAQAIAARSTVLATANRHHYADGFDLCNDDHCQCYQGTQREAGTVIAPVRETAGQVLVSFPPTLVGGQGGGSSRVVDARYAKSCGGVSVRYEAVWGAEGPEYFAIRACGDFPLPDLTNENEARRFLETSPPAWCNPAHHPYPEPWDKDPLFRWEFRYDRTELGQLVEEKTGHTVGSVQAFHVKRRGASGRILVLEVIGQAKSFTIYGELNIRRALSKSHLPSSYFVVDENGDEIILRGGGWGHGVGLCQLGAAAMGRNGKNTEEILDHYYPSTGLTRVYDTRTYHG